MIKINRIKEEPAGLFFKNDQDELIFLGNIENSNEFYDIRIQICEEKSDKYCILFKDNFYDITKNGRIINWPKGLFDMSNILCNTLINMRIYQNT